MSFRELLGRVVTLPILRFAGPGAFLAADPSERGAGAPTILLPGAEVPEGAKENQELDVFITLDSEDRPLATVFMPKLTLAEVAFLRCTSLAPFGAFFDWGLPKELLVPHKEQLSSPTANANNPAGWLRQSQRRELLIGDRHPIGLYVDSTGRLAGTMRISEMLRDNGEFKEDERVDGECWRKDPDIGVFVIVEKAFVGLLPKAEPNALTRGESARFRVSNVLPDGRIELSLRGQAYEEIESDSKRVLARLSMPDAPRASDKSSPEKIREMFGLSKKAFKRAVGRLLRERAVTIADDGTILVKN